jgi:hypothetical protein
MRKRFSGIASNLLLLALLAWAIVPPAIRHGHEGGEDSNHRHDAGTHHGQDNGECEPSSDQDSHVAGTDEAPVVLRSLFVHLHWRLFGIELSVPVSQDDQPDDGTDDAKPVVVRWDDSLPTPGRDNSDSTVNAPATASQLGLPGVVAAASSSRPPNLVPTAPLCDRARHERSGVLLV